MFLLPGLSLYRILEASARRYAKNACPILRLIPFFVITLQKKNTTFVILSGDIAFRTSLYFDISAIKTYMGYKDQGKNVGR